MKWLIERARYLALVGIFGLLVGAIAALYVGAEKTFKVIQIAFLHYESNNPTLYVLFECLDSFLVAIALIVIAVSIYELFIGELEVPDWMLVKNLNELKAKFSFVLIPVMAVKFVQKLLQSESALDTLYYGIAVAIVSIALTAFNYVSEKEKEAEVAKKKQQQISQSQTNGYINGKMLESKINNKIDKRYNLFVSISEVDCFLKKFNTDSSCFVFGHAIGGILCNVCYKAKQSGKFLKYLQSKRKLY